MKHLSLLLITLTVFPVFAMASSKAIAVIDLQPHPGGTYMMTVNAKVNGLEGRFIFDTGGGITYISPAFAAKIGCRPWGQLSGFVLTGQRLDMQRCDDVNFALNSQKLNAPIAGVYDIGKFMPPNTPQIDGSIGLDVFSGKVVTLSLAGKKLIFESKSSLNERIRRGREVPIRLVREVEGIALSVVLGVPTSKGTAWMELDSGNGGAHVIGKHLAPIIGLDADKKEAQPGHLRLIDGTVIDGPFRVNPTLTMDGNIGTRFMIEWDVTFDLARGRAWLTASAK